MERISQVRCWAWACRARLRPRAALAHTQDVAERERPSASVSP
jgi:hypothetical protein